MCTNKPTKGTIDQTLMNFEFLDVCMTNSGNYQVEIDPRHSLFISRHILRSVVHRKTLFCIDFVLIWFDFGWNFKWNMLNRAAQTGQTGILWRKGAFFQNIAAYGNAPAPQARTQGRAQCFREKVFFPKYRGLRQCTSAAGVHSGQSTRL